MQLKADDGTPLEVKEATVLNPDGEVLQEGPADRTSGQNSGLFQGAHVFRVGGWMIPVFMVLAILTLTLGAVFLGVFLVIALGVGLLKKILRWMGIVG